MAGTVPAKLPAGGLGALAGEWVISTMLLLCGAIWWFVLSLVALPAAAAHRLLVGPVSERTFASVLITGASSGIGAALARAYARPGVRLVLTARRAEKLAEVKATCEAKGAAVKAVVADVTDREAMLKHIVESDEERALELVIANAGVEELMFADKCESYLSGAQFPVTNTNVLGVVNTISPVIDRMRARKCGQIAIMSSAASLLAVPDPAWAAYSSSKIWARAYGLALRGAVQADGVGVTVICAGAIESEMMDAIKAHSEAFRSKVQRTAIGADDAAARMQGAIARNAAVAFTPLLLSYIDLCSMAFNVIPPSLQMFLKRFMPNDEQRRATPGKKAD